MGKLEDLRCAGFRFGQTPAYGRIGFTAIAVAVIGWIVLAILLQLPGVAWVWVLGWLGVGAIWAVIIWLGDTDSAQSQQVITGDGMFHPSVTDSTHIIHPDHH